MPNLITNGDFETPGAGGVDIFANWTESAGNGTLTATTLEGEAYAGTSAKCLAGLSRNTYLYYLATGLTAQQEYRLTFRTRGSGTQPGRYGVYDHSNGAWIKATATTGVAGTDFALVTYEFTTPVGCTAIRIFFYCPDTNAHAAYFDEASLQSLPIIPLEVVEAEIAKASPHSEGDVLDTVEATGDYLAPLTWDFVSAVKTSPVMTLPDGFEWVDFTVTDGTWATTLTMSDYIPAGTEYWVDSVAGDDGNNGLSAGAPKQTLRNLLDIAAAIIVHIKRGSAWDYTNGWNGRNRAYNTALIAYGEGANPLLSQHVPGLVWALETDPTLPHCYKTSYTGSIQGIRNAAVLDADGLYTRLVGQANAAAVEASYGWYSDGSTIWVRLTGDVAPSDLRCYFAGQNGFSASNVVIYLDGIDFEGGTHAMRVDNSSSAGALYCTGCNFRYATQLNGCTSSGGGIVIWHDCISEGNLLDGFKVEIFGTQVANAILVGCTGRYNGWENDNRNGYSAHDGVYTLIVDCEFHHNYGPGVQNIGNSHTAAYGSTSHDSRASTAGQNTNWYAGQFGDESTDYMLLWSCVSSGSTNDLASGSGCEVEVYNTDYTTTTDSGTITDIDDPFEIDPSTAVLTVLNPDLLIGAQVWDIVVSATAADDETDSGTQTLTVTPTPRRPRNLPMPM